MTTVYIIVGVVAFGAFVAWLLKKESEARGRAEAQAETANKVVNAATARAQADSDVNALSDDELRKRLLNDK